MNKKQQQEFLQALRGSILSDRAKTFVLDLWNEHEKPTEKKLVVRHVRAKSLQTLQQWETANGHRLQLSDLIFWVESKGYSIPVINELIEEFRAEMVSKGKHYADFAAAFQVYLRKGYLSVKPNDQRLMFKPAEGVVINRRGGGL